MRKKIIHIEDFFHPDTGYQVETLSRYMAADGYDVTVLCATMEKIPSDLTTFFGKEDIEERDRLFEKKYGVHIIRIPLIAFYSGRAVYSRQIWKAINEISPDILYVHGCDTLVGIQVLNHLSRFKGMKVVTDNHMVELASDNKFRYFFRAYYKAIVAPKIVKNNIPVIRVADIDYVEKCLGIPLACAPYIGFGSDTMLFHPDSKVRSRFRLENGIGEDAFVFCYAGKLDKSKGGRFLAESIKKKFKTSREIVFLIVGNTNGDYGKEVDETLGESEYRILRFPTQKYADLAKFYQAADCALFPAQTSLSFYDVQACGLPVISERVEINIDRNSHGNGICFTSGDKDAFRKAMEEVVNMPSEEYQQMRLNAERYIRENYDYKKIYEQYKAVIGAQRELL